MMIFGWLVSQKQVLCSFDNSIVSFVDSVIYEMSEYGVKHILLYFQVQLGLQKWYGALLTIWNSRKKQYKKGFHSLSKLVVSFDACHRFLEVFSFYFITENRWVLI